MPFLPFHRSRCPSTPSRVVAALPHSPACPAAASAGTTSPLIVAPQPPHCRPSLRAWRGFPAHHVPLVLPPCWHQAIFTEQRGPAKSTPLPSPLLCLCLRSSTLRRHITINGSSVAVLLLVTSVRGPLIIGRPLPLAGTTPSSLSIRTSLGPALSASSVARLRTSDIRRAGITTCCVTFGVRACSLVRPWDSLPSPFPTPLPVLAL